MRIFEYDSSAFKVNIVYVKTPRFSIHRSKKGFIDRNINITDFEKNNYIIAIHKEAAWVFGPKQF